jgi:hypothetical protein
LDELLGGQDADGQHGEFHCSTSPRQPHRTGDRARSTCSTYTRAHSPQ